MITKDLKDTGRGGDHMQYVLTKFKMPAVLVSGKTSLASLKLAAFSLCPHITFCLCMHEKSSNISFSSYKDTSPIGLGPHLMSLFTLNGPFKGPIFKYSHIGG